LHQRKQWNVRISPMDVLVFVSNYAHEDGGKDSGKKNTQIAESRRDWR
jgi:hypothetical protein